MQEKKLTMKDFFKKGDVVVVIFHDHGSRYIGKMFNDEWMRKMGYLDKAGMTAEDVVASRANIEITTIDKNETIGNALKLMIANNFSQLPVVSDGRIGSSCFEIIAPASSAFTTRMIVTPVTASSEPPPSLDRPTFERSDSIPSYP